MEETSVFMERSHPPVQEELRDSLGATYDWWMELRDFVLEKYPPGKEEWNFPGAKYGWAFRIKDKKRAIIYLLPRDGYFKAAFVFGQKATDEILASDIPEDIKSGLEQAKVYAEGRGIRIDITNESKIAAVKKLVEVKLRH